MNKDLQYQFDLIKKGTVEIIQEEELKAKLKKSIETKKPLRVKLGFDPSRPDIHLGHTVQLNKLKQFQDIGHKIIFIIGDFTGQIGDPSEKDSERPMLSKEEVSKNAKTYFEQVGKILDVEKAEIRHNADWLSKLGFIDVIKLASNYTVARMLERDDFKKRFKNQKSISIQEFLYPLAQAYDSVEVKADIELGGTDQKFNFVLTRDIQKAYGLAPQVIITNPLLVGLDGTEKMSKSLDNYIGIEDPAGEMFGKIMSISDELMFNYYELLTDMSISEIKSLKKDCEEGKKHPMDAKKELSEILVARFHSEESAKKSREEFEKVFSKKELPSDLSELKLTKNDLKKDKIWVVDLIIKSGFAKTKGEARRLIVQGAVKLDDEKILEFSKDIKVKDGAILKVGPKKFVKIRVGQ